MPDPKDILGALHDIRSGTVKTPLDFCIQQIFEKADPALCYLPEGVAVIRAAATADPSEFYAAIEKLKKRFGKDFAVNRFKANVKQVKAELTTADLAEHPSQLIRSENGKVLVGYENALQYFVGAKEWRDVLGFNEFTGGIELLKPPPEPINQQSGHEVEDHFDTDATRWLERRSGLMFKPDTVHRIIDVIARQNAFHPVRDYLLGLPAWDGEQRISTWLTDYCGVNPGSDTEPNNFVRFVGRMFLISAVARILQPGCQVDHMLVWEGKTGIGKSSAAKALVPNEKWFTNQLEDFANKDASMQVRGAWIIEIPEMDTWTRADEKTAKRFIDRREERLRLPYGRRLTRFSRQCVFIGTTEKDDWSHSETLRRQWPVRCNYIDLENIARDRDMLWAEALVAFRAGERWHPEGIEIIEAATEQRKRHAEDVWSDQVLQKADEKTTMKDYITVAEMLQELGISKDRWDARAAQRVGSILRLNGWEKSQKRVNGSNPIGVYRKREKE